MGIFELVGAGIVLASSVVALIRELRGVKQITRAQILAEAQKVAWQVVEGLKQQRAKTGVTMSREEIFTAFKGAAYDYVVSKGLKGFTLKEVEGLHKSAELLSQAAKYLKTKL